MSRRRSGRPGRKRARPRSYGLDLSFEEELAALPAVDQAGLLGWLRRYRRRPRRIFVELTPSGEWRRL